MVGWAMRGLLPLAQFVSCSFWVHLGINFQLEALLQNATEEQAEALQLGYWSLVGDGPPPWLDKDDDPKSSLSGMGSQYKALAMWSTYWFPVTNNTRHFYEILNMYFPQASHF